MRVAYQIPQERLDSYQDFAGIHSDNGRYNPEKGLEGLLSVLTPDPKGVVLLAMEETRKSYYRLHQ